MPNAMFLRRIFNLLPERILIRPSVQIVRAKWATAARLRRAEIGPGIPIFIQVTFDEMTNWRAQFTSALWSAEQEAAKSLNRKVWMLCTGLPPEEIEDLYAIAVQAESLVQIHMLINETEAADFRSRYVPPISLDEANARVALTIVDILTLIGTRQNTFSRATSVRASAHTFVKQLGGHEPVIAVHAAEMPRILASDNDTAKSTGSFKLLVIGDPLQLLLESTFNPRVILARHIGLSLLDELALVRFCDGYVGRSDHYAIVAADAGVPCLLTGVPPIHRRQIAHIHFVPDLSDDFSAWMASRPLNRLKTKTQDHNSAN